jgi:ACS family hexuronate transporter-like MFS transporter
MHPISRTAPLKTPEAGPRKIRGLRWWIAGALFSVTAVNYIDRETLSFLGPYLEREFHWRNQEFALLLIAFRVAYAAGQSLTGPLVDRLGTRLGLTITVAWYSLVAVLTSMAKGLRSFCVFRFLLGIGESANWPASTKAVAEWFPKHERAWAVAFFDSGTCGAAIVPTLVVFLLHRFGGWRPAFIVTGAFGFIWLAVWWRLYRPPEQHKRITAAERQLIARERSEDGLPPAQRSRWGQLVRLPQTWGIILARSLMDPVIFFVYDWLPIYIVAKGLRLENSLLVVWLPLLISEAGNFVGGGLSSSLIRRGWAVGQARKTVMMVFALGVSSIALTVFTSNLYALTALVTLSTFACGAWMTNGLVLPSDLYRSEAVATVSGMSGTGGGIATGISTFLVGFISDRYSFRPLLIGAGALPIAATAFVLLFIRNTRASGQGLVRRV